MRPFHKIGPAVLQRIVQEPQLGIEVCRKALAPIKNKGHRRRTEQYIPLSIPASFGLARALECEESTVADLLDAWTHSVVAKDLSRFEAPSSDRDIGTAGFLEACYAIVRLMRPLTVVETGVASGYSSAAILYALQENQAGKLHSVDLPAFRPGTPALTGQAVPQYLRHQWELYLGPDRKKLPELFSRIGPIDLFFYDSDKSYGGMTSTWRSIWPRMRAGGCLILDDVNVNDAFLDFCDEKGLEPLVVVKPSRRLSSDPSKLFCVGLLRKN